MGHSNPVGDGHEGAIREPTDARASAPRRALAETSNLDPETWVIYLGVVGALVLILLVGVVRLAFQEPRLVIRTEPGRTTFTIPAHNVRVSGWAAVACISAAAASLALVRWRRVRFAAWSCGITLAIAAVCHWSWWLNDRRFIVEVTPDAVTAPRNGEIVNGEPITVRFADGTFCRDPGLRGRSGVAIPKFSVFFESGGQVRLDLRSAKDEAWAAINAAQKPWETRRRTPTSHPSGESRSD
jgi:hypothetical protein